MCVAMQDLKQTMPDLGHGLQQLLDYPGDVEADMGQSFEVEYDYFGELRHQELKPGGAGLPVTCLNRREYVDLYTDWVLTKSIKRQFDAFATGFLEVSSTISDSISDCKMQAGGFSPQLPQQNGCVACLNSHRLAPGTICSCQLFVWEYVLHVPCTCMQSYVYVFLLTPSC